MICALAPSTHHLCVVGIEGLFIQGEFLRAQRVVQLDHLRKLRAEINKGVRKQQSTGEAAHKNALHGGKRRNSTEPDGPVNLFF